MRYKRTNFKLKLPSFSASTCACAGFDEDVALCLVGSMGTLSRIYADFDVDRFYTFSLLGLILCTGLLGLIAAHKIRRSGYVINLITGAAVQCKSRSNTRESHVNDRGKLSGFTFTLMLFAGMPRVDQQPNHALNTLSAALALSANTLVSTAAMVLCISVAINVVGAVRKTGTSNIFSSNWLMFSGLALPWLVFVSIALASIIVRALSIG